MFPRVLVSVERAIVIGSSGSIDICTRARSGIRDDRNRYIRSNVRIGNRNTGNNNNGPWFSKTRTGYNTFSNSAGISITRLMVRCLEL